MIMLLLLHHRIHANDDNFMQFNSTIPLMGFYPLSALNDELFLAFNNPCNEQFLCDPEEEEFPEQKEFKSPQDVCTSVGMLLKEHDRRRRQLSSSSCNIWDMDTLTGHPSIHLSIDSVRSALAEELSIRRIDSSSSRSGGSIDNERDEQVLPSNYLSPGRAIQTGRSSPQNGVVAWISGAMGI